MDQRNCRRGLHHRRREEALRLPDRQTKAHRMTNEQSMRRLIPVVRRVIDYVNLGESEQINLNLRDGELFTVTNADDAVSRELNLTEGELPGVVRELIAEHLSTSLGGDSWPGTS